MSENKDIVSIRTKLQGFSADPPAFDALFQNEVLGDAELRRVVQAKLKTLTAEAPPFEQVMAPGKVHPIRKRTSYVLWATGMAVAACLGLLLFLPVPVEISQQPLASVIEQERNVQIPIKSLIPEIGQEKPFTTQALASSINMEPLETPSSPFQEESATPAPAETDSTSKEQLIKLKSKELLPLESEQIISLDEAYAKAKLITKSNKRGKLMAGLTANGSNRLLSFVNTNQGTNPLLSTSNEFNKGINVLDGSQFVTLRSSTESRNEWNAPANITPSSLNDYEATYSLPFNIGLSLSIPINSLIDIQTGLYYTYLHSKTEGMTGTSSFNLHRELHYIGIPVNIAFTVFEQKGLRAYLAVGGAIEKGLSANQSSTVVDQNGSENTWDDKQKIYGIQPITNGMAGISYACKSGLTLFVEPGITYSYDTDQPTSIRTEEPFSFNLGLGLRFRLK